MVTKSHKSISARIVLALTLIAGAFHIIPSQASGLILYVKANASGANNGSSWTDAYTDLQFALSVASNGDEIWVAAGTYKPTTGTDRTVSFVLKSGVAIYGGFAGIETLRDQRNSQTNVAILSGDIGVAGVNTDNSYHVVLGSNTNNLTILDGFTITNGYADTPSASGGGLYSHLGNLTLSNLIFKENSAMFGGGMYSEGDYFSMSVAHPTLTNVTFINNTGRGEGGGMENRDYSQPILTNVSFIGNISNRSGGGMLNLYKCDAVLTNVTFSSNTAVAGGGLSNIGSSSTLTNVTFNNNSSSEWAGGMDNADPGNSTLTNVTFVNNTAATFGGAIANHYYANLTLTNVTVNGNSAVTNGDGVYNDNSTLTVRNSILHNNGEEEIYGPATVMYSIVQGGYAGTGNLNTDPLLLSLQDNGGFTQSMALSSGSPAIDAADDAVCPDLDQRWYTRPQGMHCDMGAYEYGSVPGVTRTPTITPSFTPTVPSSTPTNTFTPTPIPMYLLVTNTNDGGPGSLRQAITNIGAGGTIQFDPSLAGQTITLTSQLAINKNLTIDGSGLYPRVEISGNNSTRLFYINRDLTVTLRNLVLRRGKTTGTSSTNYGGAIFVGSTTTLTLADLEVLENTSQQGGAIYVSGFAKLVVSSSQFSANSSSQTGGAIYLQTPLNLTVTGSRFANNSAGSGGAVYLYSSGKAVFEENVFENNTAISGGAISSHNSPGVGLYLRKNLFVNNSASTVGGGIMVERLSSTEVVIENNTFYGNQAVNSGGGAAIETGTSLINNTFSHNHVGSNGASLSIGTAVTSELYNNIFANSTGGSECITSDSHGSLKGGNNIVEDGSAPCAIIPGTIVADPMLGALADNSGPTWSMALLPGSPAIDAGEDVNCAAVDQRGVPRPQGSHCDIGAYEYKPPAKQTLIPKPVLKSEALTPISSTTQSGITDGSLSSLSLLEQSEANDNPAAYVSFQTPNRVYMGYQSFTLPVDAQSRLISTALLQVNFKGPASSTQMWTWSIYDWTSNLWIKLGDSIGTTADQWNTLLFRIPHPQRYVSSGHEIRIQLRSNNANGDAKIDYEALHITYLSVPAASTPVTPVSTPKRPGISSVPTSTPSPVLNP